MDDKIEVVNTSVFLNDDVIEVSYKNTKEYIKTNYNSNVYIAEFTTFDVRLRLYDMLNKLGKAVV